MKRLFVSRRFRKYGGVRASARIFLPSIGKRLIVIPFKTVSIIPIILLIGASVYLFLRSDIFLIKNISIEYNGGINGDEHFAAGFVSEDYIKAFIEEKTIARSILTLHLDTLEQEILTQDSIFEIVRISRKLPDSLMVQITEVQVVAQLVVEGVVAGPETKVVYYLIDANGKLFKSIDQLIAVPQFTYKAWIESLGIQESYVGISLPEGIVAQFLEVIEYVQEQAVFTPVAYTMVDDFTIHITTNDDVIVVITFEKSIQDQIEDVSVVLDQLKFTDKKAKKIDARFDKIFVEYK